MAENHALVFWNLDPAQLGGASQPGGMQVLNIDPDDVPGLAAYFNAGWRVVSHQISGVPGSHGALLVSIYLQREFELPAAPPAS